MRVAGARRSRQFGEIGATKVDVVEASTSAWAKFRGMSFEVSHATATTGRRWPIR